MRKILTIVGAILIAALALGTLAERLANDPHQGIGAKAQQLANQGPPR